MADNIYKHGGQGGDISMRSAFSGEEEEKELSRLSGGAQNNVVAPATNRQLLAEKRKAAVAKSKERRQEMMRRNAAGEQGLPQVVRSQSVAEPEAFAVDLHNDSAAAASSHQ